MKILVLATGVYPKPGGVEKYTHQVAQTLGELYGKKNVIMLVKEPVPDEATYRPYRLWRVLCLPGRSYFSRVANRLLFVAQVLVFGAWLQWREGLNLIVCGHVFMAGFGYLARRVFGTPYVVCTYGLEVWRRLSPAQVKFLQEAQRVLTISRFTALYLRQAGVPQERISLLPTVVDDGFFTPGPPDEDILRKYRLEGRRVILTVGRMSAAEQYKGQDMVIRALPLIKKKVPQAAYLVAGTGDDVPRLSRLAEELGVREDVVFAGRVSEAELPYLYRSCAVFAMPCRLVVRDGYPLGEGFGIVFLEAAACGRPVVAGNTAGAQEAVQDGVTGILVDPEDEECVASAIVELLADQEYAAMLGEAGRQRVVRLFGRHTLYPRLQQLVEETVLGMVRLGCARRASGVSAGKMWLIL